MKAQVLTVAVDQLLAPPEVNPPSLAGSLGSSHTLGAIPGDGPPQGEGPLSLKVWLMKVYQDKWELTGKPAYSILIYLISLVIFNGDFSL